MKWLISLFLLVSTSLSATEIHASLLRTWIDENTEMVILDARTLEYDDGERIPGALWMPHDVSEEQILAAIPSKDTLIVVYCSCHECPASGWLAERLDKMGYAKIVELPGGIAEWKESGHDVVLCELGANG